jgi:DNA invertase Pin-like site-specific DNA recombinase
MLHLYAALAEKERRLIAERTRTALAAKKAREAERFAANVLPVVAEIRACGVTGLEGIAAALNGRGVRTARGGRWHVSTVRNLLARERGLTPASHKRL